MRCVSLRKGIEFLAYFPSLRKESRLTRIICCVCVCPLSTSEPIYQLLQNIAGTLCYQKLLQPPAFNFISVVTTLRTDELVRRRQYYRHLIFILETTHRNR
jgi:hypothetical protein